MTKTCPKCKIEKTLDQFYSNKSMDDNISWSCKSCCSDSNKKSHMRRTFDMTLEEYDRMLKHQDYRCSICGSETPGGVGRFHIDHNHETGEVRGLLCAKCNTGLGLFLDSPNNLKSAAKYLEKFGKNRKTLFLDIDGTLAKHAGSFEEIKKNPKMELLPGTKEKMKEWNDKYYYIILTTGRPEDMREFTIAQLDENEIPFHQLVMGLGRGPRVVINDLKPDSDTPTAVAVNLIRNEGIVEVNI